MNVVLFPWYVMAFLLGQWACVRMALPQSSSSTDISAPCLSQLTLIDLVIYGSLEAVNIRGVRWSRALRPVFLINFPESRQVRIWFRIHKRVFFFFFYWSVVELQSCVNYCCTIKWLSYTFVCTFFFMFFSIMGRLWAQLPRGIEYNSVCYTVGPCCLSILCTPVCLPWWFSGKESSCQCRRRGLDPWFGKIPWKRKWQATPTFLPGKSLEQRSLAGYCPWGCKSQIRLSD